jgi:hypothetical protein
MPDRKLFEKSAYSVKDYQAAGQVWGRFLKTFS